ncbi:MAG TPA: DUF2275 domain-containing protein [Nitrospirota bacterium]|nr:DUF2275 domain-containing protein [Nitrospirota bacterium]
MKHHIIRHKLSEYIDESVPAEEKAEIEEHLKTCTVCSDALRELKKTVEHIKALEEVEPPAWMMQKTMAKVRAEAEQKHGFLDRLFLPFHVKLPIQAVAALFLAVAAFYIYRNVQTTAKFEEIPTQQFSPENKAAVHAPKGLEPSSVTNAKEELSKAKDSSLRTKPVPQTPQYRALDMKQEYESPPSPVLEGKSSAPAQAPAKLTEQSAPARESKPVKRRAAAPQTPTPGMMQEQSNSAAGASQQAASKHESIVPERETKGLLDRIEERNNFEKIIIDRHPNGKPKLVVSYKLINSHKVQIAEERFNKEGERHGIQKEYYDSGQVKTEAQYGNGKLDWYIEFYPDGVKRIGKSDYDWFWLKN